MKIYKNTSKCDTTAIQSALEKEFLPCDTWGVIDTQTAPEQAEKAFVAAISSDTAAKEQQKQELLAQQFPESYENVTPSEQGKTMYSLFPSDTGAKILFITNYAPKAIKKALNAKSMGAGMKIHARKVKNSFEPTRWRRESWYFVAYAMTTGNENEFIPVSRYY